MYHRAVLYLLYCYALCVFLYAWIHDSLTNKWTYWQHRKRWNIFWWESEIEQFLKKPLIASKPQQQNVSALTKDEKKGLNHLPYQRTSIWVNLLVTILSCSWSDGKGGTKRPSCTDKLLLEQDDDVNMLWNLSVMMFFRNGLFEV